MGLYADLALPLARRGIPTVPLRPKSKVAFISDWAEKATTDTTQIMIWDAQHPSANCGSVAQAKIGGVWFFEYDSLDVAKRLFAETGQKLPPTFRVQSSPGRGHFYWKQSVASIAAGNISQAYVKGGDWSARVNSQYCVSPGSFHPTTGLPYAITNDVDMVEAPDWFVAWCLSQKVTAIKAEAAERTASGLIPHGSIHGYMLAEAGSLRSRGLNAEEIEPILLRLVHENCEPPIDDEKVAKMAQSICNFSAGKPDVVLVGGQVAGTPPVIEVKAPPEIDTTGLLVYPKFPRGVMLDTTIYEGLVKPATESSSKYPEMIFMPAVQLTLNYLFNRVRIKDNDVCLNMFLGLISPYGKFFKSSSCELAHKYFEQMGMASQYKPSIRNAEGRIVILQAGSTEGFGRVISGISATHAILYNDELSKMVSKAQIETSSFAHDLLAWYGSAQWGNNVVSSKTSFNFPSGSYCFSWQWCTTDRGFNRQWPSIAGIASGMEDRLFFLLSPKEPKPTVPFTDPPMLEAAARTQISFGAAMQQGVFGYDNVKEATALLEGMDPRSMQLVQMLALYFAVDLKEDGQHLTSITPDCLERAYTLVEYRNQVKKYLEPIEADTVQGRIQKEILREVKQNGGKMKHRDLCLNMDYGRFGTDIWKSALKGMLFVDPPMLVQWEEVSEAGRKVHMVGIPKSED